MKKHYIITTTNHNPTYYTFLPTVYKMWKKFFPKAIFVLGFVGTLPEDHAFIKRIKEFCDEFHYFKTIPGVTEGCQAKTTRMYLASTYDKDVCTVVDIDLYLLKPDWLANHIIPAFTENKFVSIGYNAYLDTDATGKFPMYYTTAPSNIWKRVINYQNFSYNDWFNHISNLPNPVDNKENPRNIFDKFSDESLLRYLFVRHPEQEWINNVHLKIVRPDFKKMKASKRLCRANWPVECSFLNVDYIKKHDIIDVFPRRPFNQNITLLLPVLVHMGINGTIQELTV